MTGEYNARAPPRAKGSLVYLSLAAVVVALEQRSQSVTRPRQARHHCTDWNTEDIRRVVVALSFHMDQKQNSPVFARKLFHRAHQVPPRTPFVRQHRRGET